MKTLKIFIQKKTILNETEYHGITSIIIRTKDENKKRAIKNIKKMYKNILNVDFIKIKIVENKQ